MKCDECGNEGELKELEIDGVMKRLCKSCMTVLYDICKEYEGWYCENCHENHQDWKYEKDDEGREWMVCGLCGHYEEVEPYDQEEDPDWPKIRRDMNKAFNILKQIRSDKS